MRVLIVDDEEPARERLRELCAEIPGVTVVGMAASGRAAIEMLSNHTVDCMLLDIAMPGLDGLETANHLAHDETAPAVIFCTAHDDHALEAFEARAVDYLLKPIRADRLARALERARRLAPAELRDLDEAVRPRRARTHLCARVRGNLKLVPIQSVTHLQAEDKYVVVHHPGGTLLIEDSLKDLEQEFADRFVRIHRNCLVALDRLSALERGKDGRTVVRISGVSEPLEVSRRNLPALRRRLRTL
jgi:two-component system response regulator AlgR